MSSKKTREEFVNELKEKQPSLYSSLKYIGEYCGGNEYILIEDEFGLCKTKAQNLLNKKSITIQCAIDKTSYFKNKLAKECYELYNSIEIIGKYINNKTPILVKTKYGKCKPLPCNLLNGFEPNILTAINKTDFFINKSKEVHGDLYSYDKALYIEGYKKVKIYCNIHNEYFEANPSSHIQGAGCPICNSGHFNIKLAERNRIDWMNIKSSIYIIKCFSSREEFFKIGFTSKSITSRFCGNMPYSYSVLRKYDMSKYDCSYVESYLLNRFKEHSHKPLEKFLGHTECFGYVDLNECDNIVCGYTNGRG